jgi:hypothetical protein
VHLRSVMGPGVPVHGDAAVQATTVWRTSLSSSASCQAVVHPWGCVRDDPADDDAVLLQKRSRSARSLGEIPDLSRSSDPRIVA